MKFFAFIGLLALVVLACGAPLDERVENDPELTAGFYEGDIVLDTQKNGLKSAAKRWPDGIVYYKFTPGAIDSMHQDYIRKGMDIIEGVSCIRFQEATPDMRTYVRITAEDGGCYSSVGYQGRVQDYNLKYYPLNQGCYRLGTIVHEFLHTLGFYHMQSTSNRDDFVHIAEENILPNANSNFKKYSDAIVDNFGEQYDYGSVLHYSPYAFSKNGQKTIVALREDIVSSQNMGQRDGMSDIDIAKLNHMYCNN